MSTGRRPYQSPYLPDFRARIAEDSRLLMVAREELARTAADRVAFRAYLTGRIAELEQRIRDTQTRIDLHTRAFTPRDSFGDIMRRWLNQTYCRTRDTRPSRPATAIRPREIS